MKVYTNLELNISLIETKQLCVSLILLPLSINVTITIRLDILSSRMLQKYVTPHDAQALLAI